MREETRYSMKIAVMGCYKKKLNEFKVSLVGVVRRAACATSTPLTHTRIGLRAVKGRGSEIIGFEQTRS